MKVMAYIALLIVAALALGACDSASLSLDGQSSLARDGFKVVRYNDAGYPDETLTPTITVVAAPEGAVTVVELAVADTQPMWGVALDLAYDTTRYSPVKVEFTGLVDQPLELSWTGTAGVVNAGQVSFAGTALRQGEFARVVFRNEPSRQASQVKPSHPGMVNFTYEPAAKLNAGTGCHGFTLTTPEATADVDAAYRIYDCGIKTDGNSDGATTIGDLTPMISNQLFGPANALTPTKYGTGRTDYSGDGETNISDLTPLSPVLNYQTVAIEVLVGDTTTLGNGDVVDTLRYIDDGQGGPDHLSLPFSNPPPQNTADWNTVFRRWEGTFSLDDLKAIDVNEDQTVYITARFTNGATPSPAFAPVAMTYFEDIGPATVTSISGIGFTNPVLIPGSDPPTLDETKTHTNLEWAKAGDGAYIMLLTERSVDVDQINGGPFIGNAEYLWTSTVHTTPVDYLQLTATGRTTLSPDVDVDISDSVVWWIKDGDGLAAVSNVAATRGRLSFIDRGVITVGVHAFNNMGINSELSFKLASVESVNLTLAAGGSGPANVSAGALVALKATGTFDWDADDTNADELGGIDLTDFVNWTSLVDPPGTPYAIDAAGTLDTTGAGGGTINMTCEFPNTDTITLFDKLKRVSNFLVVNVS